MPDGVLRELGVLLMAVPSSSRGSCHPERLMRGLVGLYGSPQAPGCAPIFTPSPPWPARLAGIGAALRLPSTAVTIAGAVFCFALPFTALRRGWHLPLAEGPDQLATKPRTPKDGKDDGARRL